MAEILGVVASVLTLSLAVSQGLGTIIELYGAPKVVKALQVGYHPVSYCSRLGVAKATIGAGPRLS
jgi:hypothetical protein